MKENNLDSWKKYFESKGLNKKNIKSHLIYIDKLNKNNLPIIFEFRHLRLLLGRSSIFLSKVINSSKNFYREFSIPKKNKGFRKIKSPYPSLLQVQTWIYTNILKKIKIHPCAHGFINNKSIVTNAKPHLKKKFILKLDLENFFPSIKINRIISLFSHLGYNKKTAFYLASLCTVDGELPQGAPTSPMLSNIIAYKMDRRIYRLCKKFNYTYTRYADDMTISGDFISVKFIEYVNDIVIDSGFSINKNKTRLYKDNTRKIITGIQINADYLTLPKAYKRDLKQELFFIQKFGLESHMRKKKIKKHNYLNILMGKLNYWKMIEPDNNFVLQSKKILNEYILKNKI